MILIEKMSSKFEKNFFKVAASIPETLKNFCGNHIHPFIGARHA